MDNGGSQAGENEKKDGCYWHYVEPRTSALLMGNAKKGFWGKIQIREEGEKGGDSQSFILRPSNYGMITETYRIWREQKDPVG